MINLLERPIYLAKRSLEQPDQILPFLKEKAWKKVVQKFLLTDLSHLEPEKMFYDGVEKKIEIDPPKKHFDSPHFSQFPLSYKADERYICIVKDCEIFGPSGAIAKDGKIILESCVSKEKSFFKMFKELTFGSKQNILKSRLGLKPKSDSSSEKPVLPLIPFYENSYYHWILEYLPKLRIVDLYEEKTGNKVEIIIKEDSPSFIKESLELLGYENQIIEWDGEPIAAKRAIFTQHRSWGYVGGFMPSAKDLNWVKENIRNSVDDTTETSENVYISRQEARCRKVANYSELSEKLREKDFNIHKLENISFEESIKILKNAKIVAGPHGAGLVNIIFTENAPLIELYPSDNEKTHFYLVSQVNKNPYTTIPCKNVDEGIKVDIESFENIISNLDQ